MSRAKFTDRITAADVPKMPDEYQELLVRLFTIQADAEIGGPHVWGPQWFLKAPTAEDMQRTTKIVAEEIGHFMAFNGLLREMGVDRSDLLWRPQSERYLEVFRSRDAPTWADVAAFCCLIDRVGRFQLEEMVDSCFLPLEEVLPPIVGEEKGHVAFGTRRLRELAADPETRPEAQTAVARWYPRALDMFGRSGSQRAERYVEWGLKKRLNEEARREYMNEVNPLLEQMGLVVPDEAYGRHYL